MKHSAPTGNDYDLRIERSERMKTARIRVDDGVVWITIPESLPLQQIREILDSKHRWIQEQLLQQQKKAAPLTVREMQSGEAFPYLGRHYRLKLVTGDVSPVKLKSGQLIVCLPALMQTAPMIRSQLVSWFKQQAQLRCTEKVTRFAHIIGVQPATLRIKEFKSRWGNCTANGEIQLNWRIIMAPHSVVNYVVVHELCHLKHPDHSPSYWNAVQHVIPDYLECQTWLREPGNHIVF